MNMQLLYPAELLQSDSAGINPAFMMIITCFLFFNETVGIYIINANHDDR